MSSTPLGDKIHIQARRPVSFANSVLIQSIPIQRCNEDWLEMYFTNKNKSGIESYKEIEVIDHGTAIIRLNNKDGKTHKFIFHFIFTIIIMFRYGDNSWSKALSTRR